jgi:hypothetical protein
MSGQWPPDWDDSDDEHSDAWLPDGSAVTSFLAEVGSPALPAAFEARISAAIAAEAAARASTPQAAASVAADAPVAEAAAEEAKGRVRSDNPEEFSPVAAAAGAATAASRRPRRSWRASRRAAGPAHSRPDGRRRRLRMPSAQASGWVVVCCLVIAGFGFLVTHSSGSSSSSSSDTAAAPAAAPAASSFAGASAPHAASGGSQRENAGQEPTASASANVPTGFLYVTSGTAYQASTLATQVQGVLSEPAYGSVTPPVNAPSATTPAAASASASAASSSVVGGYLPSARLAACVSRVTGGVTPRLVDKASYDGKPAYIIAVPSQVWVVGLGCTGAGTDVIARVPLKG